MFVLKNQRGAVVMAPPFSRYHDAFNYRAAHNLVGARVVEVDPGANHFGGDDERAEARQMGLSAL